jgi:TPP-dependent pyruvate/acetoin dehydrogenase alpha subunit
VGNRTDPSTLLRALETMFLIRAFEDRVSEAYARGEITGLLHLGIGQEAIAAGSAAHLTTEDVVFCGHRAHAHALAKGVDPEHLFAELAGRDSGVCSGRGGSMHIAARARGFMTATGIVAQNVPLAVGAAWSLQLAGEGHVAVAFFGDGASQSGALHESLNLAMLWNLPILFVCENNGFAEFTPLSTHTTVARLTAYADVHWIASVTVDGNSLPDVFDAIGGAVERARRGGGPSFVEAVTYRLRGHYEGDSGRYRDPAELAEWRERDPLPRAVRALVESGALDDEGASAIERGQRARVAAAAHRALGAPPPDPRDLLRWVYA